MCKKINKIVFLFALMIISVVSILMVHNTNDIYRYLWLWPSTYTLLYLFIFGRLKLKNTHSIVINILIYYLLFIKYVVYPFMVILTNELFVGRMYISIDYQLVEYSIFLGILELLTVSVFVYFLENIHLRNYKLNSKLNTRIAYYRLSGNKSFYITFTLIALIIYMVSGRNYNLINFISVSNYVEIDSFYVTLVRHIIIIGITLTILLLFNYCKNRYDSVGKVKYVIISLSGALIFILTIQGESRITQVYIAFIMIMMLNDMFPKYKKRLSIILFIATISVFISITIFREGGFDNWFESTESLAEKLQVYFGGPLSIATSIEVFHNNVDLNIGNFIFDFFRSLFGLNFILKDFGYTTSQLYNLFLYNGQFPNGQLLFSTSYGYLFIGIIGVPLTLCLNVTLACFFNKKFIEASSFELKYLFGYSMLRMIFGALQNTPSLLGGITQFFGTFGLVILVSLLFKKRDENYTLQQNLMDTKKLSK